MKHLTTIAALLAAGIVSAQSWLGAPASYTCRQPMDAVRGEFAAHTVRYNSPTITLCGLIATKVAVQASATYGDPQAYQFFADPMGTYGPDMAAGAWGWNTGAVFSGTVAVTTNLTYKLGAIPVGYAVVGVASQDVTVSISGGSSFTTSGTFDRSMRTGTNGATSISMTTTGWASVGFTQMSSNKIFFAIDGIGDSVGFTDATSINTNAGFLAYTWINTPATNYVVMRWSKYGQVLWQTNTFHLTTRGYIPAGAEMRIPTMRMWSPTNQTWRLFGWCALYGSQPTETKFTQMEIDARAEYAARGYGQ